MKTDGRRALENLKTSGKSSETDGTDGCRVEKAEKQAGKLPETVGTDGCREQKTENVCKKTAGSRLICLKGKEQNHERKRRAEAVLQDLHILDDDISPGGSAGYGIFLWKCGG